MVTPTTTDQQATKEMCKAYFQKTSWISFNEYKAWNESMYTIEINNDIWELSVCNCQYWRKNFICKHVIGIGYELKLLEFPTLDLNIEKNSKRGRRKKALPALERNSTGPLNANIFRPIQTNIEPSISTQPPSTSSRILRSVRVNYQSRDS